MTAEELIDRIAPKHDRTSCSDLNVRNAYANDQGHYRCARCVLLTGLDNGFAADTVFTVSASNKTITDAVDAVNAAERQLEAARRNLVASR
jgi:hypothetical protein